MHFKDETKFVWTTTGCIINNKTIESFSSSHSSKLQCVLLESWDVLFLSLKVGIPSDRECCIEPREYRKVNFNQFHLEIVYFFFINVLIYFKFFYGHNLFHLDNPAEEETISNPNPKNSLYPAGLDSKLRVLYNTEGHLCFVHFRVTLPVLSFFEAKFVFFGFLKTILAFFIFEKNRFLMLIWQNEKMVLTDSAHWFSTIEWIHIEKLLLETLHESS